MKRSMCEVKSFKILKSPEIFYLFCHLRSILSIVNVREQAV